MNQFLIILLLHLNNILFLSAGGATLLFLMRRTAATVARRALRLRLLAGTLAAIADPEAEHLLQLAVHLEFVVAAAFLWGDGSIHSAVDGSAAVGLSVSSVSRGCPEHFVTSGSAI